MTRQPASRPSRPSRPSRARRLRALGTAVVALTASAGLLGPAAPAVAGHGTRAALHPRPAAPRGRVASPAVLAAEMSASARAQATGKPQVVGAATTPTSITIARPNGTFQMTLNVLPVRLKVHGQWRPVSTRLRRVPGGTWRPVLVPSPVVLSGGGAGPLVVLYSGGRRLAVTWPRPLPAPAISGPHATYRVGPGLTLEVAISRLGGISLAAVARSPAALHGVRLRLDGAGLAVTTRRDGALTASARQGGPALFSGPPPSMASAFAGTRSGTAPSARSAGGMTAARTAGAGLVLTAKPGASRVGAVIAQVALTPDSSSPSCSGSGVWCVHRYAFDGISQGCGSHYNTEWYGGDFDPSNDPNGSDANGDSDNDGDFNEGQLVGVDYPGFGPGNTCQTSRAYYVMDTSPLTSDMRIQNATLKTWLSASTDLGCSHQWPLYLYDLGRGAQVDSTSDWSHQPTLPSSPYKTTQVPVGPPNCTNNREIDFTVWDPIVSAKGNGWQYWSFAFLGNESTSTIGWDGDCDPATGSGADPGADNCGQMRIGDEDKSGLEFPYVLITFDIVPPQPEPDTSDTSPPAYGGPPDVGLTQTPEDGCHDLIVEPTGWIDTVSNVSLRVDLEALDSRVNAEPEWAKYELTDSTEGTTFSDFYSINGYTSGFPAFTDTPIPDTLKNGHVYSFQAWSWVNGTGGNPNVSPITGSDSDGPYTSATAMGPCSFGIDTSQPTGVSVTSTDFPAPGSGPAGKYAGQQGTFTLNAADNPPGNCSPNPCVASGLWGYAYSLNENTFSPEYGTNTVLAGSGGSATVQLTPGNWGINNLYVIAIDRAGNFSRTFDYTFYAPFNPGPGGLPTPGDVSDAGGVTARVADLLAPADTTSGGLNLYNNPGITMSAWPTPTNASANNASPDGKNDWYSFDLTHRGMEAQEASGLDDLWAIKPSTGGQPGPGILYLYQNNPSSPGTDPYGFGSVTGTLTRPGCDPTADTDNPSNCSGYPPDWKTVTGIVAVGDAWAGDPATGTSGCPSTGSGITCDFPNQSSLVVADNTGTLWIYQDKGGATLQNPVQLGSTGWNNMTLLAPGQIDNGQLTLWARDDNLSDTQNYGKIFSYVISQSTSGIPTLNPAKPTSPVSATSGVVLPVSAPANTYPYIATPGDAGVTGGPNLYAVDTSGNIWVWPYTPSDALSTTKVKLGMVTPGTITGLY